MKRRDLLRHGLVAAGMVGLGASSARAMSAQGCYRAGPGEVRCAVGFAQSPEITDQPCRENCWADCIAYLLTGYGASVTPQAVMTRMKGGQTCRARDDVATILGASGLWRDAEGRAFFVQARRLSDIIRNGRSPEAFQPLVNALSRRPLIVGEPGHSMVLTEMSYADAPVLDLRHRDLTLRDPWSATPNLRKLSWDDSPDRMFAIEITVRAA